jgi:Pyruvate/2-oxoacid:ferredoxin oxidoreductase gamma subunit
MVSMELQDEPEEERAEFDAKTGEIDASYRIVRTCAECGTELKEATFDFEETLDQDILDEHKGEGHELSAKFDAESIEESGTRYAKSYFGVMLAVTVSCSCGFDHEIHMLDKVAASEMEELV